MFTEENLFRDVAQIKKILTESTKKDLEMVLNKDLKTAQDFLVLLSKEAENNLEALAAYSKKITTQNFGRAVSLYAPLYLSNYCNASCSYCSFHSQSNIIRKKLSFPEMEAEMQILSRKGIKHILLLTGESRAKSSFKYILESVKIAGKYFKQISIEVYSLKEEEYRILKENGVSGVTMYQETYDKKSYQIFHKAGTKKNYLFRLQTPDRAARAGILFINIGPLYGLFEPEIEAFYTATHLLYLQNKYLDSEFSVSFARINKAFNTFKIPCPLSDLNLLKIMIAFRICFPRTALSISTRESVAMRNLTLEIGGTKYSVESKTSVGGYNEEARETEQFAISDQRTITEFSDYLIAKKYQPVFKDWDRI